MTLLRWPGDACLDSGSEGGSAWERHSVPQYHTARTWGKVERRRDRLRARAPWAAWDLDRNESAFSSKSHSRMRHNERMLFPTFKNKIAQAWDSLGKPACLAAKAPHVKANALVLDALANGPDALDSGWVDLEMIPFHTAHMLAREIQELSAALQKRAADSRVRVEQSIITRTAIWKCRVITLAIASCEHAPHACSNGHAKECIFETAWSFSW